MTVDEKATLVAGEGIWTTHAIERLGIPQIVVTDGPNGARGGGLMGTGTPTACVPAGSVLGATWDPVLIERVGELLGDESVAKGANVLLAPTINLHRNPLGGRNFECYSEDPYLTGVIACAFVTGVQSRGIAVTAKHFVGNDSEFERNTIDTQVDERTLREAYLRPFEMVVKHAGAWGLMSSYNRLNGTFASEHEWLLTQVLRDEWGFDGFVVSDWFAARSTAESVKAGLSLEMPGAVRFYGPERIGAAIEAGEMDEEDLNRIARDMLVLAERVGAWDRPGGGPEKELDRIEDRELVREAAVSGAVLITNDGVLPLDPAALSSVAVIGPNAAQAKVMGGGSAAVRAYRTTSPLEALERRLDGVEVRYAKGCDIDRSTPELRAPILQGRFALDWFAGHDLGGEVLATSDSAAGRFTFFGEPIDGVPSQAFSFRATGTVIPEVSGEHALRIVQAGRVRVLLDGEVALDATHGDFDTGDEFFGFGSVEIEALLDLEAGRAYELTVEYSNQGAVLLAGMRLGLVSLVEQDLLGAAEQVAAECDAAVVVVGTNDDWETEGRDRDLFDLPGDQVEMIRRVSAANDRTIVVVNTGGPHGMGWLDAPAAVLSVGFAGQEMGDALVDVLTGLADPGGRMPTTIPARYEHSPAYLNYPGENSVVRYGEGLYIGHRFFDARVIEPAVAFGHGLSYATFSWGSPRCPQTVAAADAGTVTVEVDVTNTSDRDGVEVVQIYVEPQQSLLHRPVRELKGFAKVSVPAGETVTARVQLDDRAFAYFDPGDQVFDELAGMMPVPAEAGEHRSEPGWYTEEGVYRVVAARSAIDHEDHLDVTVRGEHREPLQP